MGLFGFIGKAIKGVGKVIGGAVKVAATGAKIASSLGVLPGGGLVGKAAGILLAQKKPMSTTGVKLLQGNPQIMRGNATQGGYSATAYRTPSFGYRPPPAVLRLSPVMPGGAVASSSGIAPRGAGAPPASYGGRSSSPVKRRRKKSTTTKKRSGKKRGGKTRARFGSKAWRKFYGLDKGKRRRKRAA